MIWEKTRVLVTGGASFIGSHLVDALVLRGAAVRVVDNLSSGRIENIQEHIENQRVEFIRSDLRDTRVAERAVEGIDVVFHLAADHGGRGYIDSHQASCAGNLALDGIVFRASLKGGVKKIVYTSSGCVYPNSKQMNPEEHVYLREDMVGPPFEADNMYGWAKLMGEMTLRAYFREYGLKAAVCRYFTVYGERSLENHAITALIARAFIQEDPFIIWGDGTQIRGWTYISDIIEGTLLAAEKIDDGSAMNIGTMDRIQLLELVREILQYTKHNAKIELRPEMPTGPLNRVADNSLAYELLGWKPKVTLIDGLHKTIDWYFQTKNYDTVRSTLNGILFER